jgi:CarboxypepD_reg-like domain
MSQKTRKFNFTLWGFIVALVGSVATVLTVPEFRCSIGLLADTCAVSQKEVDLITQSETGEALAGVKVQVIARGAPENQYTDSNGYAKVNISNKGDVRVNLSKSGYPTQDFNINLANDQNTVRIIRLAKSGQPEVSSLPTTPPTPVPQATSTSSQPSPSSVDAVPEPGAVGRLVTNASLINDATWAVEPSRVNRLLTFSFYVEASSNGDKVGNLDATLFRQGKDICTISLNSKTSPLSSGVRLDRASCYDTLVNNSGAIYRVKVKASEMVPIKVVLSTVDAVKK